MHGFDRLVVERHPRECPELEVFDNEIGFGEERVEERSPLGMLEVESDAFLVAIDAQKVRALAGDKRRAPCARLVAAARLFDLDDARAHVREQHRAVRSGEDAA